MPTTIIYPVSSFKTVLSTPRCIWLSLVCLLALPFKTMSQCTGPVVIINPKTLALTSQTGEHGTGYAKLIYRDIVNRITDSCDGDLTFASSKILMEDVRYDDPATPTAPRTLIPNGVTAGLIGNAGLIDGSGNPSTDGLTFYCTYGAVKVRVWAKNNAGNWRFGVATITVQDNHGFCTDPSLASGRIATESGAPVRDVLVTASHNNIISRSSTTSASGDFTMGRHGSDSLLYQIRATETIQTNKRFGVTTLDLALISKHLLGEQLLDSPYKIIAADVNQDGEVDALDMLIIRRFLLNLIPNLPKGHWRFIDKNYVFRDPTNPLSENFPEFISFLNYINLFQLNSFRSPDFIAVKLGDVNNSFDAYR